MRTVALAALVLFTVGPVGAGDPPPLVAIHDAPKAGESGAVSFLHPETYAVLATVAVEQDPWPLTYDPSGTTYYVLGASGRSAWSGKAKGAWTLVAVDRATSKSETLGEVGMPPVWTATSSDGIRLFTLGRGAKGASDVIGVFDLTAKKNLGSFPTAPEAKFWARAAGGRRFYILHEGRLIGFDTEALKLSFDIPLPSPGELVFADEERDLVYVLCRGGKSKKAAASPGKILVVDALRGEVLARLDAGSQARLLFVDERSGTAYALGEASSGRTLTLTVVKGTEVHGRVPVPVKNGVLYLGPDPSHVWVVGDKAVVEVDPSGPKVTRTWDLEFEPFLIAFDPERHRAFVTPQLGLKVAEIDLADGKVHMSLTTGRKGTKVGKAIGLALLGMVEKSGTASVVGPDGRFLYVVNGQTDDLTIIDTEKHAVVDHIPTGGGTRAVFAPPGVESLYVEAKDHLARIDTATNTLAEKIPIAALGETRGAVTVDPARKRIFLPHGTKLEVIDAATGQRVASVALPLPVSMVSIVESGEEPPGDAEGPAPPGNP